MSPDRSTLGPLKDAPRCLPRATCTPSGKVDSGPGGISLGKAAKAGDAWPSHCLCQESQVKPTQRASAAPSPALPTRASGPSPLASRWATGARSSRLGPKSRRAGSPAESAPEQGGRGCWGNSTGKHRPPALVLTPHLENGDSVLAARGFRGPLPLNIQHTPSARGLGPEPAPESQASGWAAPATPADSCSPAGWLCGSSEASSADPNVTPHVAGSQLPSLGAADTKATKPALTGANTSSS